MYKLKDLFYSFKLKQAEFKELKIDPIIECIDKLKTYDKLSEDLIHQAIVTMLGDIDYAHVPVMILENIVNTLEKQDLTILEKRMLFLIKKHCREDKSHSRKWLSNDLEILKIKKLESPIIEQKNYINKSSQELIGLCFSIIYGIEVNAYNGFLAFAKLTENSKFNYKYFSYLHWQAEVDHSIYRYNNQDMQYVIANTQESFNLLCLEVSNCNQCYYEPLYNRLTEYLKYRLLISGVLDQNKCTQNL